MIFISIYLNGGDRSKDLRSIFNWFITFIAIPKYIGQKRTSFEMLMTRRIKLTVNHFIWYSQVYRLKIVGRLTHISLEKFCIILKSSKMIANCDYRGCNFFLIPSYTSIYIYANLWRRILWLLRDGRRAKGMKVCETM